MQKHKILSFLLALIVSIGLWVYAVTVVNPDGTTRISDVRVRIVGTTDLTNNGLMLTGGEDQTVSVEIAGRRSDLKELNSSTLEATASVSNIDRAGTYQVSWELGFPPTVASGDIRVVSTSSNRIKVTVSEYKVRTSIPIEVEYKGKLSDSYIRDPISNPVTLNPETITVSGPAEEVNKIAKAIVTVDQDGATSSIIEDMEYRLVDENGEEVELSDYVQINDPTVHVNVPILCYKQIDLKVDLIPGGGATEDNVDLKIEPAAIGVTSTSASLLKDLDEYVIREIDLAEVTDNSQTWTFRIELPDGVKIHGSDDTAKVTVTFRGLITETFLIPKEDIERIDADNDKENLSFKDDVEITVRGTREAISAIRAEDIKVYADMDTYDTDTMRVKLRIELPKNSTAGVIGAYTAVVTVSEATET